MYPHVVSGMAPRGGGGSPPPPGREGLPEDKSDEGSDEEENEEGDTDEETVSVTTSSQASAGGAGPQTWDQAKETYRESTGGPPEDPNDPSGEGGIGESRRGPWVKEGKGEELDPPGRMEPLDLWDLLALGGFLEGTDYLLLWDLLLLLDWGYHQSLTPI